MRSLAPWRRLMQPVSAHPGYASAVAMVQEIA
jgi:hypothetical protein